MKKFVSILLVILMIISIVGCGKNDKLDVDNNTENQDNSKNQSEKSDESKKEEEDPFLTGEKPEINILTYYTGYNMEEQPSYKVVEDMTGYKVKWFNLPQENADEKLLLEIAGGSSYDLLMRMSPNQTNQLYVQNALLDLKPYLDKYGENIYSAVSERSLNALTDDKGMIYALPHEAFDGPQPGGKPYGVLKGGIGFNTSYLEELNKDIPKTLDEFYDALKAYTDKTGKPALTQSANAWNNVILAAFGMGDPTWYDIDGEYVHRIRHPRIIDYLSFMQKLYKEGILDNDFPVNTVASAKEKFTNGITLAYPVMFWDADGIYSAFASAGIDTKMEVATFLAPDSSTSPTVYIRQGILNTTCIPKTSKNPEHAMIWFNTISDIDNFEKIYLGEKDISYEIKDGGYYPIFPAFNDYTNSDKFTGIIPSGKAFEMWQARARKTEAMAEMYDQMNSRVEEYEIVNYYENYAASLEAVQKNQMALNTMVNDFLIKAIVDGGDPKTAIDNIIAEWEKTGGNDYEKAMKTWYKENKEKFD